MKPFLLDTNVISELRKSKSRIDANVLIWAQGLDIESCFLSVISLYELEKGIFLLEQKDPEQAAGLAEWFEGIREVEFRGRILAIDANIASKAASMQSTGPKPMLDTFIAATALEHNMIIATTNSQDFIDTGATLVNPWEPGSPISVMM